MTDRKTREQLLHAKLSHEYEDKREGTRNGRYYSKAWLRAMLSHVDLLKIKSILDIGCGTGILYEVLKEQGYKGSYIGTDLSPDMINVGLKRFKNVDLRVMDCEKLDFPSNSFDLVFMRNVLHHIPTPVKATKEMKRVAKKYVLIAEPTRNILTEFPRYLSKKLTNHFDEDHTHFSVRQLSTLLRKGGINDFRIIHFGYLAYPFGFTDILPGTKHLPLTVLKGLFKVDLALSHVPIINYLSWNMTAVCKK